MGIAKRHIGYRNIVSNGVRFGTSMSRSVRAEPPIAESLVPHQQTVLDPQAVADAEKCVTFPFLGPLSVADVECSCVMIPRCNRSADAGIHPATQKDDCSLRVSSH